MKLISRQAFRQYMDYRGETNRSLAAKCPEGIGRAIIGHLRSGVRDTCSPTTAKAIEKALNAPPGSLFMPTVTTASQGTRQQISA